MPRRDSMLSLALLLMSVVTAWAVTLGPPVAPAPKPRPLTHKDLELIRSLSRSWSHDARNSDLILKP
jgi:hypothetical protein